MKMIRAIIRPEKADEVTQAVLGSGHPALTQVEVYGRGKQKGLRIGSMFYDELPKVMLLIVIEDEACSDMVQLIMKTARTGEQGNFGDGRIFISDVMETYTISSGKKDT